MTNKLVVILGPTSSGKSDLAIKLAKKFKGEIISADSRQVYKGLDLGTGKVSKHQQSQIPHHLLDIVSPKSQYTVARFQHDIKISVDKIMSKGKIPFVVGGSAFYIYAAIDNLQIPQVKPSYKLRKLLAKKSTAQLFTMLKKLDPNRAKNIDKNNPVRLIRAIEIIKATGKPIPRRSLVPPPRTRHLIIGIKKDPLKLRKLIFQRVDKRLKQGMVKEVKNLHKQGLTHARLQELGLEYRFISRYLTGKLTYQQMVEQLKQAIWKFSKRQMTWFKRDKRIVWISSMRQAEKLLAKL